MFHGRPELGQQLRSAICSVRTSLERGLADGPAGYGGLYRRKGETNPKARRRAENLSRLENAEWGVEDQKNPPEFRERPRMKSTEEIADYVEGQIQRAIARGRANQTLQVLQQSDSKDHLRTLKTIASALLASPPLRRLSSTQEQRKEAGTI
mmetsp:Transcript_16220/g.67128  ORF Transcript_16220/g.67128 Transcript_16220/m.67128 type:complete len:152 (-) Transcript_16220:2700-3155(-)